MVHLQRGVVDYLREFTVVVVEHVVGKKRGEIVSVLNFGYVVQGGHASHLRSAEVRSVVVYSLVVELIARQRFRRCLRLNHAGCQTQRHNRKTQHHIEVHLKIDVDITICFIFPSQLCKFFS